MINDLHEEPEDYRITPEGDFTAVLNYDGEQVAEVYGENFDRDHDSRFLTNGKQPWIVLDGTEITTEPEEEYKALVNSNRLELHNSEGYQETIGEYQAEDGVVAHFYEDGDAEQRERGDLYLTLGENTSCLIREKLI